MNEGRLNKVRRAEPIRLTCDEMLAGLARWLRAAGYDTWLANSAQKDDEIVACSRREERTILTLDRGFARSDSAPRIVRLGSHDLDQQAIELKATLGINWLFAPFTRCMIDNTPLADLDETRLDRLPASVRRLSGPFRECPTCGRAYWPGSHAKRILHRLGAWASQS